MPHDILSESMIIAVEPLYSALRRRLRVYDNPGRLVVVMRDGHTGRALSALHVTDDVNEAYEMAGTCAQELATELVLPSRSWLARGAADKDTAPIEPPSLRPEDCLPVPGQPGYVVCAGDPYREQTRTVVDSVVGACTTLSWPDDGVPGGRRRQVFTTRVVTSSIDVAAASRLELKAAGWWWL